MPPPFSSCPPYRGTHVARPNSQAPLPSRLYTPVSGRTATMVPRPTFVFLLTLFLSLHSRANELYGKSERISLWLSYDILCEIHGAGTPRVEQVFFPSAQKGSFGSNWKKEEKANAEKGGQGRLSYKLPPRQVPGHAGQTTTTGPKKAGIQPLGLGRGVGLWCV